MGKSLAQILIFLLPISCLVRDEQYKWKIITNLIEWRININQFIFVRICEYLWMNKQTETKKKY